VNIENNKEEITHNKVLVTILTLWFNKNKGWV